MNPGIMGGGGVGPVQSVGPLRMQQISSGTDSYVALPQTRWLHVTLVPGGAGGNSTSAASTPCTGGKAGIPVSYWLKSTKSAYPYAIGAGGTGTGAGPGNAGGNTTFDTLTAYGAPAGTFNPAAGQGLAESSPYGQGGSWPAGNASGFGAGGGGTNGGGATGGSGSGGLLIIEEY